MSSLYLESSSMKKISTDNLIGLNFTVDLLGSYFFPNIEITTNDPVWCQSILQLMSFLFLSCKEFLLLNTQHTSKRIYFKTIFGRLSGRNKL